MPSKFLNLSTDTTLGGATPSDTLAASQKAIKAYADTKAPLDTFLAPNFEGLTPIATYEFDTSSTSFYKLLTFNNIYATTEDIPVAHALFRITATIGGKTSIIDAIVETQKALTYMRILSNHTTGYTAGGNTGIRYIRTAVPKALNDGNDWELDISAYNATARHIKVEVFQSDNGFAWFADGSTSTITTSTHSSANLAYYTVQGTIIHPSITVTVTNASVASYITGRLPKLIAGTMPLAGAALLANQFCFMSNSLVYPATENTVPINTGFGLAISYAAVASGAAITNYYINQKMSVANLDAIPHATLARGAPCFFRCTMDASGNIFSDNYVATEMTPGYTWYYVGVASSATAIIVDTTSSVFLTLDLNGKLTHVNGKKLAGGGGGVAIDNLTITENTSDEIQAVATVNANTATGATNPIYDWVGTLAEYTAQNIATAHPDWLCYITDDNTAQAFDAYSKTESDARYVQQGHQVIEFQEPTADNNYTWYRLYADGWVEQGGIAVGNPVTITLPIVMANSNYMAVSSPNGEVSNNYVAFGQYNYSTTGFQIKYNGDLSSATSICWQVSGMAA